MTNKQYRTLRDSVHANRERRNPEGKFLGSYVRYPRGRDYNQVPRHVPRDPDIIMYHDRPAQTKSPTVETRTLGESLLVAWAMCRGGELKVAKTRSSSYYSEEELGSVFEEDDNIQAGPVPSMSEAEIQDLYDTAMHEVEQYNRNFGGIDYWSPVTRKWHTRRAQLGDEVQMYRGSSDDLDILYGEEPKDPNERQDAANHKYDDRYNRMQSWEENLIYEEFYDTDTTGRLALCLDKPFGKWVLEGRSFDRSPEFRFKKRSEFYEDAENHARQERQAAEKLLGRQ